MIGIWPFGIAPAAIAWTALAADAAARLAAETARELSGGPVRRAPPRPVWTSPHRVALELEAVTLRDFSPEPSEAPARGAASRRRLHTVEATRPALICAPLALHGATIADFAPGHSLAEALATAGVGRLFVTDWRSATSAMRLRTLDDYFADLNVLVDTLGPPVDLVGLCQGGWMALAYAARFPDKVARIVVAGAPVDLAAAESRLSRLSAAVPLSLFEQWVALGDGLVEGERALAFWTHGPGDGRTCEHILQTDPSLGGEARAALEQRFLDWFATTLDLPGTYYLDVVRRLFKENRLADGTFDVLGRPADLRRITAPLWLLAASDDDVVAPDQLFATARLVGSAPKRIRTTTVAAEHLGLFMGRKVLAETWPQIARWLLAPDEAVRTTKPPASTRAKPKAVATDRWVDRPRREARS